MGADNNTEAVRGLELIIASGPQTLLIPGTSV